MQQSSRTAQEINRKTEQINRNLRAKEVFDPRILDADNENKSLWTSDSVELAVKGLSEGYKLKENPFLKTVKGVLIRKAHLPFKYTQDEMDIMRICASDKNWFANNFGRLKDGDKGWAPIKLRPYQENLLKRYEENRWNIVMFPRQSGKTTTTILEILHFCIFNVDKDAVVIAQSDTVVNEILAKIKEAFAGLPFFMQPGFITFNKKGFVLDNGCRLSIGIAAESVVQGFSLDLLYIDEFAYIKPSLVRKFWNNIYPALINNPNSRCIITSTPNGRNMFYELWTNAEAKLNKFQAYRIYWWDVPGRDEQFKRDTIANVGIQGWEMGFECSFDTQLKSIFNTNTQKTLRINQLNNEKEWSPNHHPVGNKYNISFLNPVITPYNLKTDFFLVGIDLGEGLEQDATVMKIKKIDWDKTEKKLIYTSIGVFNDNTIAIEDFAQLTMDFSREFSVSNVRYIVENNTYGGEYFGHVKSLKLNDNTYGNFDMIIYAKFRRESRDDFEYGIRWNWQNKKLAVKSFSNLISSGQMLESHYMSVEEYLNFGKQKNDTYAAQYGNDDLVMGDVSTSYFIKANNMYSNAFLLYVKDELRFRCDDEDEEIVKRKAEEKRKAEAVYKHNGFTMRDHTQNMPDFGQDIYLFGL